MIPLFSALLASQASAQVDQDLGAWESVNLQASLHKDDQKTGPRLWTDLHFRRWDTQFLAIVRPGIGFDVARGVSVFAGYAWVPSVGDATEGELLNEHRIWEQALLTGKVKEIALGFRPRLEQRFEQGEAQIGHRLRLWGRAGVPLRGSVSLSVTDEVFLGFNKTEWTKQGFDQNRLFVGPALGTDFGRVEFGYMNVYLDRDADSDLHLASANLFVNL